MKSRSPHRIAAMLTLGCVLAPAQQAWCVRGQDDASATAILLGRARTLEQRGRLDLAKQDWSQVLLADPNEAEALAGLVRAARAEGRTADADTYLARLRTAHPNSPELARLQQGGGKGQDGSMELEQAAKLARGGDARAAMVLYRKVYGMNPPPGAPALVYYETEASTEDGRPHAIAGLRAMADRFPGDARYQVALGRVLLQSARTRAEGRTILEGLPGNPEAVAALREPASGAQHGSGTAQEIGRGAETALAAPAAKRPAGRPTDGAAQVAEQHPLAARPSPAAEHRLAQGVSPPAAGSGRRLTYVADEQAAFDALDEHRTAEAEQRFREILTKDPRDARALAGMGYLRASLGDLKAAVTFFEQAQESGDRSLALTRAMVNAQFELALKQAATQRAKGDLPGAEEQYRAALRERPNDPEALEGLGGTLLQAWRPGDAIAVYDKLTRVRPMDPAAWRGLVVADASAGHGGAALSADAQVPAAVRSPLAKDQSYQRALAVARDSQGTQVARVELPAGRPAPAPENAATAVPAASAPAAASVPSKTIAKAPQPAPKPGPVAPSATKPETATAPVGVPPAAVSASEDTGGRTGAPAREAVRPATRSEAPEPRRLAATAEEVQQADLALLHGKNTEAATMFRDVATRSPERAEGWRGLVLALHNGGHEAEAATVLAQIPASARVVLDRDASFQAAAGDVFLGDHQPNEALRALARAQDVFSGQRLPPPLELVLATARLLAARGDDENLYRELMYLGERTDLNDARRVEVQMIWTRWAVRRARALAGAGEDDRAITVLNAAAAAFAGNPEVVRAVADGYAGIGRPREAVALYRTQDLNAVPARAIEAAVSAATTARDFRVAETWMRIGLERFANDPQMLNTAAELAQARGHEKRAVALSEQAKGLAPAQNPGEVLATELKEANAGQGWAGGTRQAGQLGVLLAPSDVAGGQAARPYLPAAAERSPGSYVAPPSAEPPVLAGYDEPSR